FGAEIDGEIVDFEKRSVHCGGRRFNHRGHRGHRGKEIDRFSSRKWFFRQIDRMKRIHRSGL
ncbi:MAG: hypothetical protein ACO3FQ_07455, partial [Terrimicrobiaceae bacterium]